MTSAEDIEKLKKDIELDMLDETSFEIFTSILKDLEELKKCVVFACSRMAGKEIRILNETLHKSLDKPILWLGTDEIGNKYIVPQKQLEEMNKDIKLLNTLAENTTDIIGLPDGLYMCMKIIPKEFIHKVSERKKENEENEVNSK